MQLLAHPLRIASGGSFVAVEQDSEQQVNQTLQVLIGTRLGERPMADEYGLPDPVWLGLAPGDINTALEIYGPPAVQVEAVNTWESDGMTELVEIEWTRPAP